MSATLEQVLKEKLADDEAKNWAKENKNAIKTYNDFVEEKACPYIVDIQHELISDIATRLVIPLGKLSHFKNEQMQGLTPQLASMPSSQLKDPIGSLSHFRDEIVASLDFAITGI